MKATVDATLAEVRKKISEAKKATDLLQALVKLRKLRTDRLHQQGKLNMNMYELLVEYENV